jgi:hypothetical protein
VTNEDKDDNPRWTTTISGAQPEPATMIFESFEADSLIYHFKSNQVCTEEWRFR